LRQTSLFCSEIRDVSKLISVFEHINRDLRCEDILCTVKGEARDSFAGILIERMIILLDILLPYDWHVDSWSLILHIYLDIILLLLLLIE